MSSMRNAVQRRNHRERAQPQERSKWGLLEKRKDYKLRAADHKVKKRKIKALQQKASERNEDEFYFAMVNGQSKGGVKVSKRGTENSGGGKPLSNEVVKLMKTQDAGYLRTQLQQTKKQRERAEQEVAMGGVGVNIAAPAASRKRTIFGDEGMAESDQLRHKKRKASNETDERESLTGSDNDDDSDPDNQQKQKQHRNDKRQKNLAQLKDREEQLTAALDGLENQRAKMNGTLGGINKNGVEFKARSRKR